MKVRIQREAEIFCAALDMPEGLPRQRFLDQTCRGNSRLRARVRSLLALLPAAERFFDATGLPTGSPNPPPSADDDKPFKPR